MADSDAPGPGYDAALDLDAEFRAVCARFPAAALSWRRHTCAGGQVYPV